MSLLNDALRAAEQRQGRPEVSTAYTGQVNRQPAARRWLVPVMAVLLVILVVVVVYGYFFRTPVAEIQVTERTAAPAPAAVPEVTEQPSDPASTAESESGHAPEPEPDATSPEPQTEAEIADTAPVLTQPVPQPRAPSNKIETKRQPQEPAKVASQPAEATPKPELESAEAQAQGRAPAVKQVRETAETIDLRVSREIARLLRAGESRAAEQMLADVASNQVAPVSRGVYARAMLLQDSPGWALPWVSGEEAQGYPELRLLRARALLSMGRLNEAVTTLSQDVPPVADNIEYRITLATLTQQAGENVEAARHWSALIAVDDSQPTWWVGLAIALEAGGQTAGALKAYTQAAQLPGLSQSLADYVRNRMTLLQAG
ncbi:MSHA biogenesis protein MshN [Marinobacter sediminum]|uniref:MSHA biogenesis protein MshN n=1 Tax=Marinobacter sediminum TaxID=256323 RepID=UPI0019395A13|nr:MSHA biogenesis protein MshN [Marinobacter sediminum]